MLLSLLLVFILLHFDTARIDLFGVPFFAVELAILTSFGIFLFQKFSRKGVADPEFRPIPKAVVFGTTLLLFGVVSSILFALSPGAPCPLSHEGTLHALGILKSWFLFPLLFGFLVFQEARNEEARSRILFLWLLSFVPIALVSFFLLLSGSGLTYDARFTGPFNSPNTLAMHLTPGILLAWFFLRSRLKNQSSSDPSPAFKTPSFAFHLPSSISYLPSSFSRLPNFSFSILYSSPPATLRVAMRAGFFILLLFLLFLTHSVSAWIAVGIGILAFEFLTPVGANYHSPLRNRNFWMRANDNSPLRNGVFFLLLFVIVAIVSQWNNPRFDGFFDPDSRSSFASRVMIWESAGKMLSDSPFFGIGPGNFQSCYLSYQRYFPPYLEWSVPEPHNIFLAFWLGGGLIGLSAFGFLLLWWFRTAFRSLRTTKNRGALLALAAILLTTLVHGLSDTPYWQTGLAILFWTTFSLGISHNLIPYIFPSRRFRKKSSVSSSSSVKNSAS